MTENIFYRLIIGAAFAVLCAPLAVVIHEFGHLMMTNFCGLTVKWFAIGQPSSTHYVLVRINGLFIKLSLFRFILGKLQLDIAGHIILSGKTNYGPVTGLIVLLGGPTANLFAVTSSVLWFIAYITQEPNLYVEVFIPVFFVCNIIAMIGSLQNVPGGDLQGIIQCCRLIKHKFSP